MAAGSNLYLNRGRAFSVGRGGINIKKFQAKAGCVCEPGFLAEEMLPDLAGSDIKIWRVSHSLFVAEVDIERSRRSSWLRLVACVEGASVMRQLPSIC